MSIRKRRTKYGYVYDVTLEYGTVDGRRDRKKRTFRSLKEAEKAEKDAERLRGALRHQGRLKLGEYITRFYWPIASRRLEPTTLDTYKREIDLRIMPCLGEEYLEDLDRLKIQRMIDVCATESVGRKAHGLLKTILNEAVGDGFIMINPAMARYAMPAKGRERDNGLILTDFAKIKRYTAEVMDDAPVQVQRLVMSGFWLGLRPEERYALDWEDFHTGRATVTVKGAYVTASKEHGGVQMKGTKTKYSQRTIPMPPDFIMYWISQAKGKGAWITNAKGGRLSPSTGRKMWCRWLDAHPFTERITLENMRHSFATACLHAGMNVEDVSRMLGHSDINTTYRRYVKPDFENIRQGLRKTSVT